MPDTAKRVLMTVNPDLVAGKRLMTVRAMVTALDKHSDLFIVPITELDFRNFKVTAYRRARGGKFEKCGRIKPTADLWINYTDGYYLDYRKIGYARRIEFLDKQLGFYQQLIDTKAVSHMVNTPEAERATLKSWFLEQDCKRLRMISTYTAAGPGELDKLLKRHGKMVGKPIWGGDGMSVHKLDSKTAVDNFIKHATTDGETFDDYVFQPFREGPEKRLWFAGTECIGGRTCTGRRKPWDLVKGDIRAKKFTRGAEFERDLAVAGKIWKLSGLSLGSVDFIGDEVNEINGCGTTYIQYQGWDKVADARPGLIDYLVRLVKE